MNDVDDEGESGSSRRRPPRAVVERVWYKEPAKYPATTGEDDSLTFEVKIEIHARMGRERVRERFLRHDRHARSTGHRVLRS